MRATLVTAPDYHALHLVYTARRLFQVGQAAGNWFFGGFSFMCLVAQSV